MDGRRRTDPAFDDLERLLGEIPSVSASVPNVAGLNEEAKTSGNNGLISPALRNYPTAAFDLNSAFSDLSFAAQSRHSSLGRTSQDHVSSYSFTTNSYHGIEAPRVSNGSPNLSRSSNEYSYFPAYENVTTNIPSLYLPTGAQYPEFQFPVMPDQRVVMENQPRDSYQQPQANWRSAEYEQLLNMQQQYLSQLQKLQAPQMERGSIGSRFPIVNGGQPSYEAPLPNNYEQYKRDSFCSRYGVPKSFTQSNLTLSSGQVNGGGIIGRSDYSERRVAQSVHESVNQTLRSGMFFRSPVLQTGRLSADLLDYQMGNTKSWDYQAELTKTSLASRYMSLNGAAGKILLMAKDQYGCRFLQRKFSEGNQEEIEMIFEEIIDHIVELMTDPFGNYLVQKLLDVCNDDQLMKILQSITRNRGELYRVSCDMHGTRAVQKVIETLRTPEHFGMIVSALDPDSVMLMKDMNGNHVAQKCVQHMRPEFNEFLFATALMNCKELAKDRHGCCVLQNCLSHSDGERRRRLISEITAHALILAQDPYGNYVVQCVYELGLPFATNELLDQLDGRFGDLSVQKHSSNVVEDSLKYADAERRAQIIDEIIDHPRFDHIMQDAFGNYVIQAALALSKGSHMYPKLVNAIKPHIPMLRSSPYGKKVLASLGVRK